MTSPPQGTSMAPLRLEEGMLRASDTVLEHKGDLLYSGGPGLTLLRLRRASRPPGRGNLDGGKRHAHLRPSLSANFSVHVCPSKRDSQAIQESSSAASLGFYHSFYDKDLGQKLPRDRMACSTARLLCQGPLLQEGQRSWGCAHQALTGQRQVAPLLCLLSLLAQHLLVQETGCATCSVP